MKKASTLDLLTEICRLGQGEIPEHKLLRNLDISHGYFCRLRQQLVKCGMLVVTHPQRKAHYHIPTILTEDVCDKLNGMREDVLAIPCQTA